MKSVVYSLFTFYRAMLCIARTLLSQDVPLSVRPSVTRRYSIETAKHVIKRFSPSGSHSILVFFHTKRYVYIPTGTLITGVPNANRDYRPIYRFTSETIQDTAIVTMEGEQETVASFRMLPFPMILNDF